MARSKRRHEEHEEHVNHERWLVSYADMMTLLMVLFIVMFAISQVDQRKFDELKDGMAAGFGATASPFTGSSGELSGDGSKPMQAVGPDAAKPDANVGLQTADQNGQKLGQQQQDQPAQSAQAAAEAAQQKRDLADAAKQVANLQKLKAEMLAALAKRGLKDDVEINIDQRGLVVSLVSRHIVFHANEANLTSRGRQVVDVLAPVLRRLPQDISVDGNTNQVKVKPKYYPSDWELSAARAVTVLRYLSSHGHVPAARMVAVAHGHEEPLRDPALPGAAELNKRVDIVVLSQAPEQDRRLYAQVVRDHGKTT